MIEDDPIRQHICAMSDLNDPVNAQEAAIWLIEMGPASVDQLIEIVRAGSVRQSWQAASVLAEIDDPRCTQLMEELLTAHNSALGALAVGALEKHGVECVDRLLEALPVCSCLVQLRIVEALECMGDRRAVIPLMELLGTTVSPTLRYTIIQALGTLGDTQAVDLIRSFCNDSDHHVCKRAHIALDRLEATPATTSMQRREGQS